MMRILGFSGGKEVVRIKLAVALLIFAVSMFSFPFLSHGEEGNPLGDIKIGIGGGWVFPKNAGSVGALISPDVVGFQIWTGEMKIEPNINLPQLKIGKEMQAGATVPADVTDIGVDLGVNVRYNFAGKEKTFLQFIGGAALSFISQSRKTGNIEGGSTNISVGLSYGIGIERMLKEDISLFVDALAPSVLQFSIVSPKGGESTTNIEFSLPFSFPRVRVLVFLYF